MGSLEATVLDRWLLATVKYCMCYSQMTCAFGEKACLLFKSHPRLAEELHYVQACSSPVDSVENSSNGRCTPILSSDIKNSNKKCLLILCDDPENSPWKNNCRLRNIKRYVRQLMPLISNLICRYDSTLIRLCCRSIETQRPSALIKNLFKTTCGA